MSGQLYYVLAFMPPIINEGGPEDRMSIDLSTKKGTWIRNTQRQEQILEALTEGVRMLKETYPDAELRSVTATYNCFGHVFAARRTHVFQQDVELILREDGYRQVLEEEAMVGDIVLYKSNNTIEHVAEITEIIVDPLNATKRFVVLSKWGGDGEYRHDMMAAPILLGTPSGFYSERRTL
jgi:hypothetical protein